MINIAISTNVLIIISILIFILIIGCIVFIIYKDKKADQKEIDDILNNLVESKPREVEVSKIESKEEEKLDLEDMLEKMQKDLETSKEQVVSNFETEQEEKAIISYQELIKNTSNENYQQEIEKHEKEEEEYKETIIDAKAQEDIVNDVTPTEEHREKVSKEDIFNREALKIVEEPINKKSKFKNTEFISPVYGKMEENLEYPTVKLFTNDEFKHAKKMNHDNIYENSHLLEETLNIKPISDEIKKNDEFLKALKEFRGNL